MKKKQLINQIAYRMKTDSHSVQQWIDIIFDSIYETLKNKETVTIDHFGTFYINERSAGTVFKFNPAQKMRKMFGWSSTYKVSS